jgi:hypothetical protein
MNWLNDQLDKYKYRLSLMSKFVRMYENTFISLTSSNCICHSSEEPPTILNEKVQTRSPYFFFLFFFEITISFTFLN